jgi:hypothetical protein
MPELVKLPDKPDEAHFQISQKAAENLGRLVDGNGLKAEQVRLAKHETLVHQLPGQINIKIKPEIAETVMKGNMSRGKSCGGREGAKLEADAQASRLALDPNIHREMMQFIDKDAGQGFGIDLFKLPLAAAAEDYSASTQCGKCAGNMFIGCVRCNMSGSVTCSGCSGQGAQTCRACFGSGQYTQGSGNRVPCSQCNASGRIICTQCSGQREMRCSYCQGAGRIGCAECDQTGWWTYVYSVTYTAEGLFALDRQQIPQDVMEVIDHIGVRKLATDKYIEVFRLNLQPKLNEIGVPMVAFLPIARAEFTVEGKAYPATVAGLIGRILVIDHLIDHAVKPGINALFKLSKGPMATEALVDQACKYRLIRQALTGVSYQSKKQVYQQIVKQYPVGLSDKYAKAAVKYAGVAVLALSQGPRKKGLLIGSGAAAVLAAAYFMAGIRPPILAALTQSGHAKHMLGVDIAVWLVGYAAAVLTIKLMAASALRKILPDNVSTAKGGLPSAGNEGLLALATSFAVWVACAFAAPVKPEWVMAILKAAGIGVVATGG